MKWSLLRLALRLSVILAVAWVVPRTLCGRSAEPLFRGDRAAQLALAREVAREVKAGVGASSFRTGSERFDGEWALVADQMAVLGLGQVILAHPETREELLPAIDLALARLKAPVTHRFATAAWAERGLAELRSHHGHAYLGYVNLAFGMDRLLRPDSPHGRFHDHLTASLARRLQASPTGMIETYPGETYPPDVSAVAASIALQGRATGNERRRELLDRWSETLRERYLDRRSGLLVQSVRSRDGVPLDRPRASGTALAAYFLAFADRRLASDLYGALLRNRRTLAGFGGILEYPAGHRDGLGDIDSGPVLLGVGLSATGFALASARVQGDRGTYRFLLRTATLFGAPTDRGQGRWFVTGGPLGNAIMLAVLTAGPGAAEEVTP